MKKSITIKIYLLTLLIIFSTSVLSMLLLFYYMDPESNLKVAIATISVASFLTLASFMTLAIYFFKKIYYRWEIFLSNLNSSLRQWILMTIYILWVVTFYSVWVYNMKTATLLFVALLFIELIFQSMSN
ncbi:MAG: hypothetical protein ACD_2C00245G0002 [uncultured bacterium (gcode 4)]|uniref:Uncharacterized protein n=1 Tax=uncultured bacterium (gcode 4) TaxID=1234023 RepID=K2G403_9BACT|nr:MAG: hypothetical protein ACD_2C00245G0002 [uncultured bacterium (gcode 4)]